MVLMGGRLVPNAAASPAGLQPAVRQDRPAILLAESDAVPPQTARARVRSRQHLLCQLAQFGEAIAVTRRSGVGRDVEHFRNLGEGQTTPDLQRDHLAVNTR